MKCLFVRHKKGPHMPEKILKELRDKKLIALHFEDVESFNPDDYKREMLRERLGHFVPVVTQEPLSVPITMEKCS